MTLLDRVSFAFGETKEYSPMDGAHDFHLSLLFCFPIRFSMAYVIHPQALVAILRVRKAVQWKITSRSPFLCNAPSAVEIGRASCRERVWS
jgi:hypothetical protein